MSDFPYTIILRHRKENLNKCSLRGLESREDMRFFSYPKEALPPLDNYILLTLDAPPLTKTDKHLGIFLIDGTWKHAETMFNTLPRPFAFKTRSIPSHYKTAYPRRQEETIDQAGGLASLEALYIAYLILERDPSGLLDNYYWKKPFLKLNEIAYTERDLKSAQSKGAF